MRTYEFTADFDADQIRLIYSGAARNIMVTTSEGLRIELPAMRFRNFVYEGRASRLVPPDDR